MKTEKAEEVMRNGKVFMTRAFECDGEVFNSFGVHHEGHTYSILQDSHGNVVSCDKTS